MNVKANKGLYKRMKKAILWQPVRRRRKLFVGALKGRGGVQVSLKGLAFLCAIEAGMVQEIPGGDYDNKPFLRFWDEFSRFIRADRGGYPNEMRDVIEMLKKEKGGERGGRVFENNGSKYGEG